MLANKARPLLLKYKQGLRGHCRPSLRLLCPFPIVSRQQTTAAACALETVPFTCATTLHTLYTSTQPDQQKLCAFSGLWRA